MDIHVHVNCTQVQPFVKTVQTKKNPQVQSKFHYIQFLKATTFFQTLYLQTSLKIYQCEYILLRDTKTHLKMVHGILQQVPALLLSKTHWYIPRMKKTIIVRQMDLQITCTIHKILICKNTQSSPYSTVRTDKSTHVFNESNDRNVGLSTESNLPFHISH